LATRKLTDWDSIEPLYRAGAMSNCEICRQYEADHVHSQTYRVTVTETAIRAQAKKKGWQKDIAEKVKSRVREKLVRDEVRGSNLSENDIIEQATEEPVKIALGQRARTAGALDFQDKLLQELREQFQAEKELSSPAKPVDVMRKVRAFKDLVVSLKGLQDQQSIQYGLGSVTKEKTLEDFLSELD